MSDKDIAIIILKIADEIDTVVKYSLDKGRFIRTSIFNLVNKYYPGRVNLELFELKPINCIRDGRLVLNYSGMICEDNWDLFISEYVSIEKSRNIFKFLTRLYGLLYSLQIKEEDIDNLEKELNRVLL